MIAVEHPVVKAVLQHPIPPPNPSCILSLFPHEDVIDPFDVRVAKPCKCVVVPVPLCFRYDIPQVLYGRFCRTKHTISLLVGLAVEVAGEEDIDVTVCRDVSVDVLDNLFCAFESGLGALVVHVRVQNKDSLPRHIVMEHTDVNNTYGRGILNTQHPSYKRH